MLAAGHLPSSSSTGHTPSHAQPSLRDLVVHGGPNLPRTNPFVTQHPHTYASILFSILPHLPCVDGRDVQGHEAPDACAAFVVVFFEEPVDPALQLGRALAAPSACVPSAAVGMEAKEVAGPPASQHLSHLEAQLLRLTSLVADAMASGKEVSKESGEQDKENASPPGHATFPKRHAKPRVTPHRGASPTRVAAPAESHRIPEEGASSTESLLLLPTRIPKLVMRASTSPRRLVWQRVEGPSPRRDPTPREQESTPSSPSASASSVSSEVEAEVPARKGRAEQTPSTPPAHPVSTRHDPTAALWEEVVQLRLERERMRSADADQFLAVAHLQQTLADAERRHAQQEATHAQVLADQAAVLDAAQSALVSKAQALSRAEQEVSDMSLRHAEAQEQAQRAAAESREAARAAEERHAQTEEDASARIAELQAARALAEGRLQELEADHAALRTQHEDLTRTHQRLGDQHAALAGTLQQVEQQLERLGKRCIRDRESHAGKLAKRQQEADSLRAALQQREQALEGQRKEHLDAALAHQQEVGDLTSGHRSAVEAERHRATSLQAHLDTTTHALGQVKEAYALLEAECHACLDHEQARRTTLQGELGTARTSLASAQARQAEMDGLVRELNGLLTTQEAVIQDLERKHKMTHTVYQVGGCLLVC
jgi:hypothetical protein